ncbi:hypothetical protein Efla_002307 [Eimeria flavescens]
MISVALLELFFPGEANDEGLHQFVSLWLDFFSRNADEMLPMLDPFTLELPLVLSRLVALSPPPTSAAFVSSLRCSPKDVLQAMACALHALLLLPAFAARVPAAAAVAAAALTGAAPAAAAAAAAELPAEAVELAGLAGGGSILVCIRLMDLGAPTSFNALRSNQASLLLLLLHIGRLVSVHGAVLRVHSSQPLVERLAFECAKCSARTTKLLTDGRYEPPQGCPTGRCPSRFFVPLRKLATAVDVQRIRLQEVSNPGAEASGDGLSEEPSRNPAGGIRPAATIDCEFVLLSFHFIFEAEEKQATKDNSSALEWRLFTLVSPGGLAISLRSRLTRALADITDLPFSSFLFLFYLQLTGFLVGECCPGDRVCLTGIVQARQSPAVSAHLAAPHAVDGGRLGGSRSLYTLYLSAVSVAPLDKRHLSLRLQQHRKRCSRNRETPQALLPLPAAVARRPLLWKDFAAAATAEETAEPEEAPAAAAAAAEADTAAAAEGDRLMEFIAEAYTLEPRRFELLASSIAPSIVGRHIVKAGLLLALLGGVPVMYGQGFPGAPRGPLGGGEGLQRRGTIHVLLLGDAGVGKSRLLQAAAAAANSSSSSNSNARGSMRSVFVCGNTASAAGLTAAAVREAGTGELIIEAGALVLADGGVCCIDELDKMPAAAALTGDSASLLEAMEQQTVTICKASCCCCLPARTTMLAAANPREGRFDPRKSFSDNVNLSAPLLSRFDLIFLLHDKPAAAADARLAAHVFSFRPNKQPPAAAAAAGFPPPASAAAAGGRGFAVEKPCLEERLVAMESGDLLPLSLLQDYICYAREHVHPKLSPEAAAMIKAYFLVLRQQQQQQQQQGLRVATRQLESLIRLCQARARADLRPLATAEDAKDVIEVYGHTPFASPSLLAQAAAATGCTDTSGNAALASSCVSGGRKVRRGLQGLVLAFARECAAALSASGSATISQAEALKVASLLVSRAQAAVPAEAVVNAANEAGVLLKREGKWLLDRSLLTRV